MVNGVPQQRAHISGLLEVAGRPAEAASYEGHFAPGGLPAPGTLAPADVLKFDPLKLQIHFAPTRADQQSAATLNDAQAQVVAQLINAGADTHAAGESDALGIAFNDPNAADGIAAQVAAALGTPISVDVDTGGVTRTITVGGGSHLSSAEAAQLLATGTPATALITAAVQVQVPQAMMPGPEATLWDLSLEVQRGDGTTYAATTRSGYRSEARRAVLGAIGLTIPVRVDPSDESRVAVDGDTYDRDHPGAPGR